MTRMTDDENKTWWYEATCLDACVTYQGGVTCFHGHISRHWLNDRYFTYVLQAI
jgi:hypothetical protein